MNHEYEIAKEYCIENIDTLVHKLKLDLRDCSTYYVGCCPVHHGDNQNGFTLYKNTGAWICWTKNCNEKFGGDIIGLISALTGKSRKYVVKNVKKNINISPLNKELLLNRKVIKQMSSGQKDEFFPEFKYKWHKKGEAFFIKKRGFLKSSIKEFEVGVCLDKNNALYNRIVFPVRNENGRTVGYTGRYIGDISYKDKKNPKWKHIGHLNNYLFNFHKAYNYIKEKEEVILVEGVLGVIRLWEAGIKNAVCIFGCNISKRQREILLGSEAFSIILALDNDNAGISAIKNIAFNNKSPSFLGDFFRIKVIKSNYFDLDEMTIQEVKDLLKEENLKCL